MKICPKCGKEFPSEDSFCNECGIKLKQKKPGKESDKKFSKISLNWLLLIIPVAIILISVFIFAVPMPYTATETYTGKEPYKINETYYENEEVRKITDGDLLYYVLNNRVDYLPFCQDYTGCLLKLAKGDIYCERTNSHDIGLTDAEGNPIPGWEEGADKTTCYNEPQYETKQVEKTREVTKYKDVEKQREVTKYAPLFRQWAGKG